MLKNIPVTKEQKEAVWLISIGTFLEYFDLMLYIHMVDLLNSLFFPEYDPHITKLVSVIAFCSIYCFRPIGALLFGWIGDTIGRKPTVIITTFIMSISCVAIASLPTYKEIGITASIVVSICRIIQSMTCLGEIIGAEIYLTELIKNKPSQYASVSLLSLLSGLGGTAALGIASITTSYTFNWRYAFIFGAIVALIGLVARTAMRETPDFVNAKRRLTKSLAHIKDSKLILKKNHIWTKKVNKITALAFFFIYCAWPASFYLAFMHCGTILKTSFGYTTISSNSPKFFCCDSGNTRCCAINMVSLLYISYFYFKS